MNYKFLLTELVDFILQNFFVSSVTQHETFLSNFLMQLAVNLVIGLSRFLRGEIQGLGCVFLCQILIQSISINNSYLLT